MKKIICLPVLGLVSFLFLSCSTSNKGEQKNESHPPKDQNREDYKQGDQENNSNENSNENQNDQGGLTPNNPGYCGYSFELETDNAIVSDLEDSLAQTWQGARGGLVDNEDGKKRTYYQGMKLDPIAKVYSELRIYYETVFTAVGKSENIVETKEISSTPYSHIYFSKPHKVSAESNPRMVVLETEKGASRCLARGFEIKEGADQDRLFVTSLKGTSSYGNSVKAVPIAEFFSGNSLFWGYKVKK
jgi:hypothetical protein